MASPIFWWSYSDKYEEKHGPSIINQHEAEMVAALCLWLLSQRTEDERTQRIQVLTPYRAQVRFYLLQISQSNYVQHANLKRCKETDFT